jgi:DNA (cytosine-5)-methyltransferase 1
LNFWEDLNAKDYGIPQNRERCFCVSFLAEEFTEFIFPKPIKLEKVMKDFLEEEVDEKYYLNSPKAKELIKKLIADGTLPTEQNPTEITKQGGY